MVKRKHPSSTGLASASKVTSKPATNKASAKHNGAKSASKNPTQFARPMRPLDASDSEEEEQDHDSDRHDRRHMDEIDEDADADEEDDPAAEAMDSDDSDVDAEMEDAEGEESVEDQEDGEEHAPEEETEEQKVELETEEETPLEYDLPLQIVQGTYSGVLYGLKTKLPLRELRAYHQKLHSKRGIEETDMEVDDDEGEDDEDELEAEQNLDHEDAQMAEAAEEEQKQSSDAPAPVDSASATSQFGLLFTNAAHIGSVKSLAISADGKWMVSGGIDESIKIYKTAVMREFGQLHSHSGSVVALEFYGNSFLLSGGQEGDLCIWSTKTWSLLRKFPAAHVGTAGSIGGVSCLAVHPSGRVALSVGATDRKVKLWDLMKGTLASERTLDFVCTSVKWSVGGEAYAIVGDKRFDVYDTSSTLLRREEVSETKLLSAVWLSAELLAIGCEDKSIRVHRAQSGECVVTLQAHQARVRGLDCTTVATAKEHGAIKATFLASADTNGQSYLWDVTQLVQAYDTAGKSHAGAAVAVLHAFHPCCQSFHDQRVTLLKILPQYQARKNDLELKKPVQIEAAKKKQQEVEEKKKANAASTSGALSKSEREAAKLAKSKSLFEKAQRSHVAKELAAAKARRLLAKHAPGGAEEGEDGASEPAKKKQRITFEEAPMIDSDDEPAHVAHVSDDDGSDEELQPTRAPVPPPPAKKQTHPASKPAPSAVAASKSKPAPPAPKPKVNKPKLSQKQQQQAQQAKQKTATPAPASAAPSSSSSHAGFSAALPMFKPKLNDQRKKNKSAKKQQRDADRSKTHNKR